MVLRSQKILSLENQGQQTDSIEQQKKQHAHTHILRKLQVVKLIHNSVKIKYKFTN